MAATITGVTVAPRPIAALSAPSCCRCQNCTGPQFCETQDPFIADDCNAYCQERSCISGTEESGPCEEFLGCEVDQPACCLCRDCDDELNRCADIPLQTSTNDCHVFCQGCGSITISVNACGALVECPNSRMAPVLTPWVLVILAVALSLAGLQRLRRR